MLLILNSTLQAMGISGAFWPSSRKNYEGSSLAPDSLYYLGSVNKKLIGSKILVPLKHDKQKTLLAVHLCLFHKKHSKICLPKDLIHTIISFMPEYIPSQKSFKAAYLASSYNVKASLVYTCPFVWTLNLYAQLNPQDKELFKANIVPLVAQKKVQALRNYLLSPSLCNYHMWDPATQARIDKTIVNNYSKNNITEAFLTTLAQDTKTHTKEFTGQLIKYLDAAH